MLHESLTELSAVAPKMATLPETKGVLAEAQDLLRNALSHDANPAEAVAWYSNIVLATLDSPAIRALAPTAEIYPTGPFAQGDGLPTSQLRWFSLADPEADHRLVEVFSAVGLHAEALLPNHALTRQQWTELLANTSDAELICAAIDAGSWLAQAVAPQATSVLYQEAIAHRPGALRRHAGLPDRDINVDVTRDLLNPIAALARWAAPGVRGTAARLRASNLPEAADLLRAWEAGLNIRLARWADRVARHPVQLADLPALQRTTYGAAARTLAGAIDAVTARADRA